MIKPKTSRKAKTTNDPVATALQDVLASTYGLYLATHNYHWNVEGINFVPLHDLFDVQYNELFQAVDVIAERIRALGEYALPFEGDNIMQISKMTSHSLNKETDAELRAERMIHNLMSLNESVINTCQAAKKIAQETGDDESDELLISRVTAHQKAMWVLSSIVK